MAVHRERATQGAFPPACHHFGELGTVYIAGNNFGGELLNFWWSLFACNTQIKIANISSYHHNIGELDIMLVIGTVYTTSVTYIVYERQAAATLCILATKWLINIIYRTSSKNSA